MMYFSDDNRMIRDAMFTFIIDFVSFHVNIWIHLWYLYSIFYKSLVAIFPISYVFVC